MFSESLVSCSVRRFSTFCLDQSTKHPHTHLHTYAKHTRLHKELTTSRTKWSIDRPTSNLYKIYWYRYSSLRLPSTLPLPPTALHTLPPPQTIPLTLPIPPLIPRTLIHQAPVTVIATAADIAHAYTSNHSNASAYPIATDNAPAHAPTSTPLLLTLTSQAPYTSDTTAVATAPDYAAAPTNTPAHTTVPAHVGAQASDTTHADAPADATVHDTDTENAFAHAAAPVDLNTRCRPYYLLLPSTLS